jgi:transcriptional regulator with XRE-family HTH domain
MQQQLNLIMVKKRPPFRENADMSKNSYTAELIGRRLTEMGKTQEWLAEKVGVSINAVSKWTRTGQISRDNAILTARALGLTVGELLHEQPEDMKKEKPESGSLHLVYLTSDELKLVTLYRESTQVGQAMLIAAANAVDKIAQADEKSADN